MKKIMTIAVALIAVSAFSFFSCTNTAAGTDNSGTTSGNGTTTGGEGGSSSGSSGTSTSGGAGTSTSGGATGAQAVSPATLAGKVYLLKSGSNQTAGENDTEYMYFSSSTSVSFVRKTGAGYVQLSTLTFAEGSNTGTFNGETRSLYSLAGKLMVYGPSQKCTRQGSGTGVQGTWELPNSLGGGTMTVGTNSITMVGQQDSIPYTMDSNGFVTVTGLAGPHGDGYGYFDGTDLYANIGLLVEVTDASIKSSVINAQQQPQSAP